MATYLLKFAFPHETIGTMLGTSSPSDRVISIKFDTSTSLLFVDDLKTVVVNEHVGGATLQFVCRDSLLDGFDSWCNNRCQTLLVNGTLDGDVRKDTILQPRWAFGGIIFRVRVHLADGTDALSDTTNDDLGKELG